MAGIPRDVTLRLDHARHHLQTLNAQFGDFGARDPYDTVTEVHPTPGTQEGWGYLRAVVNRPPRPEWSLTIGDCVHSLRAALDFAVFALWSKHSGEPTDRQIKQIQFPIYDSQAGYRANRGRRIGGLHPGAKRAIRSMQPYQRRNDAAGHPLAILNALDVYDKHRFLHTTSGIIEDAEVEILERENVIVTQTPTVRTGGFSDGEIVARLKLLAVAPRPKLTLKLKTTYGVAFDGDGPGAGRPVAETLNELRLYVRDAVLARLEPHF